MQKLLSRDVFRKNVIERDKNKCVFCNCNEVVAHHIIERRLWSDGGYYLDNGASVCAEHHILCEQTIITVEDVRKACNIIKPILPEHLYNDDIYDKWGNAYLSNGLRVRGELFYDDSVQKILKEGNVLDNFTNRVKYPRTYHLPWSNVSKDDKKMSSVGQFFGKRIIVTEKKDGENTTCYNDYIHARSIDSRYHYSRDWIKNFWSTFAANIPQDWRICGENLYAKHSIAYNNLDSYFEGFSIWNDRNVCLSWDDTLDWFELLGIKSTPILYDGIFNEEKIRKLYDEDKDWNTCEGYVVRLAESFSYGQFRQSVGKYVRKNHIQSSKHWINSAIIKNKLAVK